MDLDKARDMKEITLTKHEIRLFLGLLGNTPPYLREQLGDMSKRTVKVAETDHDQVRAAVETRLAATGCKAARRRLQQLLLRLDQSG